VEAVQAGELMRAATRGVGVTSGRGIWRWSDWRAEEPVLREINNRDR